MIIMKAFLGKALQKQQRHLSLQALRPKSQQWQRCVSVNYDFFGNMSCQNLVKKNAFNDSWHYPMQSESSNGCRYIRYYQKCNLSTEVKMKLLSIGEAVEKVNNLQNQMAERLQPLPPVWSSNDINNSATFNEDGFQRQSLFNDITSLLGRIENSVNQGKIRPSSGNKHGRQLSHVLGRILFILSELASPLPISFSSSSTSTDASNKATIATTPYEYCRMVLSWLDKWNLHIQPEMYELAIIVACRENLFSEASDLFWLQINPERSGYLPMSVECSNPVGLYAVARNAKSIVEKTGDSTVAEHVFDAVLNLSMVSPTDQDRYVLAAGVALGLVGEWSSCVEYLKNSNNSARLGQSLIAGTMQACMMCSQYDKALDILLELKDGPLLGVSSEYQWSGGSHTLNPICRDVALRSFICLGRINSDRSNDLDVEQLGRLALKLFRDIKEEGTKISVDAIKGVLSACELSGRWEDSVSILSNMVENFDCPLVVFNGNDLTSISTVQSHKNGQDLIFSLRQTHQTDTVVAILPTVMRTCNAAKQYALALSCAELLNRAITTASSEYKLRDSSTIGIEQSVLSLILDVTSNEVKEDILLSTMVSLCGLNCTHKAIDVYEMVMGYHNDGQGKRSNRNEPFSLNCANAFECYTYAKILQQKEGTSFLPTAEPGYNAYRHIDNLIKAIKCIKESDGEVSPKQKKILGYAVAQMMRTCTASGQAETGLYLAKQIDDVISANMSSNNFFSLSRWATKERQQQCSFLISTDSLFAEKLSAYRAIGCTREALDLVVSADEVTPTRPWIQTVNETLRLLIKDQQMEAARSLYNDIHENFLTAETLCIMANAYAEQRNHQEIDDLYAVAVKNGILSEELAFLTMDSIVERPKTSSYLRKLRSIIDDTAHNAGMDSKQWLYSRYWPLKQCLGWHNARLLMWWNDVKTSHDEELDLAISHFHERRQASLVPKDGIVKCIVDGAMRFNSEATSIIQSDRDKWINLIYILLDEVKGTSLNANPNFIGDIARVLRLLHRNDDCVKFVCDAAIRGVLINSVARHEALKAVEEQGLIGTKEQEHILHLLQERGLE